MKIYTRTGDDGETGLLGGGRVSKSSLRVRAYGDVDELNAALGLVVALIPTSARESSAREGCGLEDGGLAGEIRSIQGMLFNVGAELAAVTDRPPAGIGLVDDDTVRSLERAIDRHEAGLAPLTNFVLPGGNGGGAALHLARTICRRAERSVVELAGSESVRGEIVRYLNRLSDLLFVMARAANAAGGCVEPVWHGRDA